MKGSKARLAAIIAVMLTLLAALLLAHAVPTRAVVGPAGYYELANGDIIEICSNAARTNHTMTFAPGNTVYLRVTTDRVNKPNTNWLYLRNYLGNQVGPVSSWTQVTSTPPYVYTTQITIPASTTTYLQLDGLLRKGGERVQFQQALGITGVNQSLKTYSDAAYTDEADTFRSGAVMYLRVYGSGSPYSAVMTGNNNALYDLANSMVTSWPAPAVTQAGNWYSYPLTLPATGLTSGDYYQVMADLRDNTGGTITSMSRIIRIDDDLPTAAISSPTAGQAVAGTIAINGTAADAASFLNYQVDYGAGVVPATWTQIGTLSTTPVADGFLRDWDTTTFADGLYTLRLTVTDRAYNVATATVQVVVDNVPLTVSDVTASGISSAGATVTWNSSEPADSQVEYGTSPGVYTSATVLDATLLTSHSQALSGLTPSTVYYYRVRSADVNGMTVYSAEASFKTANITVLQLAPGLGNDTQLRGNQPTWNLGRSMALAAGDTNDPLWGTARSMLRFDLAGIPVTATINSATMSLYQWSQGDAAPQTIDAHYLTRGWAEGTGLGSTTGDGATWSTYDGASAWTAPGGDYNPAASASAVAPDSTGAWVNWNVTGLTQSWVNGGVANNGILLKRSAENPAGNEAKLFYSADYNVDPTLRPVLTIEWLGDDATGPAIGDVRALNIRRTTADIRWSTDEAATSQVEYGTTTSYGAMTPLDSTTVNQHQVSLTGLSENVLYHYRVRSVDASGNMTVSGDFTFQTAVLVVIQPGPGPGIDNSIAAGQPSANSGAWNLLLAGDIANPAWQSTRASVKFNLNSIPAGSTINSATMSLYQWWQGDTSTPAFDVHYLTRSWTEGTGTMTASGDGSTWSTYDGAAAWTAPGGDYNPAPSASATAPNSTGDWVDWDLTALVRDWTNATVANNGVIVKKAVENPVVFDVKGFHSSEYADDPALRPMLVVEYVAAPGSITLVVDETFNRDGNDGAGSVGFGTVNAGTTYYVGDTLSPQYAVRLSLISNGNWGLRVSAADDLVHSASPASTISIANLNWKADGGGLYQPFVKTPAWSTVTSGQPPTAGTALLFDYQFIVPPAAVSGNYTTAIEYLAYTE
ncbi:MAG: DNRLRE domain-containing protein [Thermoleophilia bacterium]